MKTTILMQMKLWTQLVGPAFSKQGRQYLQECKIPSWEEKKVFIYLPYLVWFGLLQIFGGKNLAYNR